jgi:hypothetical protein
MESPTEEFAVPARDVVRHETARALLEKELENRRLRNHRYSMRAFARSVGLSQTQLSLILAKKRDVSLPQAMKLAQVLGPDVPTLEKLLGISFFDVVGSNRTAPGASEAERFANLERGVVVNARDWPTYLPVIEKLFRNAPEAAVLVLATRASRTNPSSPTSA